jgi:hypothetical protein
MHTYIHTRTHSPCRNSDFLGEEQWAWLEKHLGIHASHASFLVWDIYIYISVCVYIYIHMYVCMYACKYVCKYVYVCMYVCMCVCMYVLKSI